MRICGLVVQGGQPVEVDAQRPQVLVGNLLPLPVHEVPEGVQAQRVELCVGEQVHDGGGVAGRDHHATLLRGLGGAVDVDPGGCGGGGGGGVGGRGGDDGRGQSAAKPIPQRPLRVGYVGVLRAGGVQLGLCGGVVDAAGADVAADEAGHLQDLLVPGADRRGSQRGQVLGDEPSRLGVGHDGRAGGGDGRRRGRGVVAEAHGGGEVRSGQLGHGVHVGHGVAVDDDVAALATGVEAGHPAAHLLGGHRLRGRVVVVEAAPRSGQGDGGGQRSADLGLQLGLRGGGVGALAGVRVEVEHDHAGAGADAHQRLRPPGPQLLDLCGVVGGLAVPVVE